MNDAPYTNYFVLRPTNSSYFHVEQEPAAWTLESGFVVTNNYGHGYNGWSENIIRTQSVIALGPGTGSFQLAFTNLWPGTYNVRILGVVTNDWTNVWRAPLIWKVVANDGATVTTTNVYHLIQNYVPWVNYDIGQIWVQAIRSSGPSNHFTATFSLDASSEVSVKVVSLFLNMPVDWSDTAVFKNRGTLYSSEEWQSRTNFAGTNTAAGTTLDMKLNTPFVLPTSELTAVERTNAFRRWLPLNAMTDEASGSTLNGTNNPGGGWAAAPIPSNYQYYRRQYLNPFEFTNSITSQRFTWDDFRSGATVPGSPNDYNGWSHSDSGVWSSSWGSANTFSIYRNIMLSMIQNNSDNGLPYRWHSFPYQTNAGHVGGLIMAQFALTYPTYRLEAMDINSNIRRPSAYLGYPWGRWSLRRTGKFEYDGWAGTSQNELAKAVDWIWPFIASNQRFADYLTEHLPWIESNTNHVQRHFYSLLRSLAADHGLHSRGGDPMLLGSAMQAGNVASNLMNPAEALINITPGGETSWKKHYAGTYTRDGGNLIGSSLYMVGENALLDGPNYTRRYTNNGGQIGQINISDASKFPKLAAFVDWYAEQQVGYNYSVSFGDAAQSINEPPALEYASDGDFLLKLWRVSANARLGKYLASIGRTTQTDSEWSTMQAQAASEQGDIRLSTRSRIFGGTGLGILESGLRYTNQIQRGGAVLRAGVGYGHDHGDHLDLNIYALGARMGTDFGQRNEGSLYVLPNDTATKVHNVVEVDGYNHPTSASKGWPGGNTEGGNSWFTAFSTNGKVQFIGGSLAYGGSKTNVQLHRRDIALVEVDATNCYTVDFQRVHGGRWHSWSFHGADVGGESNSYTVSLQLTNVALEFTDTDALNLAFTQRKYATNATFPITAGAGSNRVWAEWRLGRSATVAGTILNADGSGGAVTTIAPEQAMFGSSYSAGNPRKIIRATLFDRTNDVVSTAWAFSPNYKILQPRLCVVTTNGGQYFTNFTEKSGAWAALYDPYLDTRYVSSDRSIATSSALGGAFEPKVIEVVTTAGTDTHCSSESNEVVTAEAISWRGTYAFTRKVASDINEMKLVGGWALTNGSAWVVAETNLVSATILAVNYTTRTMTLASAIPVRRTGWYRIRSATHETSYYITNWTSPTNASFSGDPLVAEFDVTSVSGNTITISSGVMPLAAYPKRGTGLTAVNESGTRTYGATYDGSVTVTRTGGDSVVTGDFTDVDGDGHVSTWVYDFGPGDALEVPSEVSIERGANLYVQANCAFQLSDATPKLIFLGDRWLQVVGGNFTADVLTGQRQRVIDGTIGVKVKGLKLR